MEKPKKKLNIPLGFRCLTVSEAIDVCATHLFLPKGSTVRLTTRA